MSCSSLSDEELLVLIKNDSWKAFAELYARYSERIYGYYLKKINTEEAQDLTQKCLIRLHEKAHTFNPSYPAAAWIFTLARNLMNDEFRRRARVRKLQEGYAQEVLTQEKLEPMQLWSELQEDIERLEERQKSALILRYREGREFEEIAVMLDISPANARQLVSRAIRNLRKITKQGEDL